MTPIPCFLVVDSGVCRRSLRRFTFSGECPGPYGGHNAWIEVGDHPAEVDARGYLQSLETDRRDPRWPTTCAYCDYVFSPEDQWQTNQHTLYEASFGRWTQQELPAGAMFYPSWLQPTPERPARGYCCPTDGSVLCVIVPENADGTGTCEWIIDAYCSNCDRKGEVHHCWCRSGTPPHVTVSKSPPPDGLGTCGAGGGSIWIKQPTGWHGFLRDGSLFSA